MRHSFATSFAFIMLSATNAYALSCAHPVPFSQNVFFKGTILSVDGGPKRAGSRLFVEQGCSWQYQIRVDEPWYGAEKGDVLAVSQRQWICGARPVKRIGEQHNIALNKSESGEYVVGMCSQLFFNPHGGGAHAIAPVGLGDGAGSGELSPAFQQRLKELKAKPVR